MNTITFETQVMTDHQLRLDLPATLPIGCKLRVIIEPLENNDPLDWALSTEERAVWEELPEFRAAHPLRFAALENDL